MFRPSGYEKYIKNDYMKFEMGANKIRILEEPITGYLWWVDAKGNIVPRGEMGGEGAKPVRAKPERQFTNEEIGAMKMFAAMTVWNYDLEKIQILEVTQAKIMNGLDALSDSRAWGDIRGYPIVITKEKTGPEAMNVSYSVMPEPKEELPKEIVDEFKSKNIKLSALYEGEDPFGTSGETVDVDEVAEDLDGEEN